MIKLIITSSGHIESSHMARIFWCFAQFEDENLNIKPDDALKHLINEIVISYRVNQLFDFKTHLGHSHKFNNYDLTIKTCSECGKPIFNQFYPENFRQFLSNLTYAVCSASIGELSIDEMDHWDPWMSYEELFNFKPKEILLVEENFDLYGAASVTPNETFSEEEQKDIIEFAEENKHCVSLTERGFWRTEPIY